MKRVLVTTGTVTAIGLAVIAMVIRRDIEKQPWKTTDVEKEASRDAGRIAFPGAGWNDHGGNVSMLSGMLDSSRLLECRAEAILRSCRLKHELSS